MCQIQETYFWKSEIHTVIVFCFAVMFVILMFESNFQIPISKWLDNQKTEQLLNKWFCQSWIPKYFFYLFFLIIYNYDFFFFEILNQLYKTFVFLQSRFSYFVVPPFWSFTFILIKISWLNFFPVNKGDIENGCFICWSFTYHWKRWKYNQKR